MELVLIRTKTHLKSFAYTNTQLKGIRSFLTPKAPDIAVVSCLTQNKHSLLDPLYSLYKCLKISTGLTQCRHHFRTSESSQRDLIKHVVLKNFVNNTSTWATLISCQSTVNTTQGYLLKVLHGLTHWSIYFLLFIIIHQLTEHNLHVFGQ